MVRIPSYNSPIGSYRYAFLSIAMSPQLRGLGSNPTAAIWFSLYKTKGAFLHGFKIVYYWQYIPFKSITFCKTVGGHTDSNHGPIRLDPIALHLSHMALLEWPGFDPGLVQPRQRVLTNTQRRGITQKVCFTIPVENITRISGFQPGGLGSTPGVGIYFSDLLDNCQH